MVVSPSVWVGLMPGRLSFGYVGRLHSVGFGYDEVAVELRGLSLTEDAFDVSKLAMSGTSDISSLLGLQESTWPFVYMMMATHQGGLRTIYHEQLPITIEPSIRLAAKLMDVPGSAPLSSRGVLIDHLVMHCPRYMWSTYFLEGDETWHEEEARLAQSLKAWEKTYSILKRTLCPPTSSC